MTDILKKAAIYRAEMRAEIAKLDEFMKFAEALADMNKRDARATAADIAASVPKPDCGEPVETSATESRVAEPEQRSIPSQHVTPVQHAAPAPSATREPETIQPSVQPAAAKAEAQAEDKPEPRRSLFRGANVGPGEEWRSRAA